VVLCREVGFGSCWGKSIDFVSDLRVVYKMLGIVSGSSSVRTWVLIILCITEG
jgi:hypothetical protein